MQSVAILSTLYVICHTCALTHSRRFSTVNHGQVDRNARSLCSCTVSDGRRRSSLGLHINWSKTKTVQFCNPATCSTVHVADGQIEVVDSFVYLGSTIDSTGGSRGDRDPASDRIGMELHEPLRKRIWKSSIRLNTKLRLYHSEDPPHTLHPSYDQY